VKIKFFKGKPAGGKKSSDPSQKNPFQGISSARNDSGIKCFYCGRTHHIGRDCYKKYINETTHRHKRCTWNFLGEDENDDLKLFMSNIALSTDIDEVETRFMDSEASNHMTYNKH